MHQDLMDIIGNRDKFSIYEQLKPFMSDQRQLMFEKVLDFRTRRIAIAVEDVYHAHNSSALVRTADCFGLQDVHVIRQRYPIDIDKEIAKGAEKWMNVQFHQEGEDPALSCITDLKAQGYNIIAATPHTDDIDLPALKVEGKMALFFGAEKLGISETVIKNADQFVKIPMFGFTESFNVSVACSIFLAHLMLALRELPQSEWGLTEDEKNELRLQWAMKSIKSSDMILQSILEGS